MQESPQRVFLYVFSLPDHDSELYFSKKVLVQALKNLLTFAIWHCSHDITDPYFLVACILGSIFSIETHLYINPLYLLELGLKPDLVFNPRLVASTVLLRRVFLIP